MTSLRPAAALLLVALALSCMVSTSPVDPETDGSRPPGVDPPVSISTNSVSLGADRAEAQILLRNHGEKSVDWTHVSDSPWAVAIPAGGMLQGGGAASVRLAVDRLVLPPGHHAGRLVFLVAGESLQVEVSVEVPDGDPVAGVFPTSLTLGPGDVSAGVDVVNAGTAPLAWSWSGPTWARVEPASGATAPGGSTRVTVTPVRSQLADGSHSATLTLNSDGGTVGVTLSVVVATPPKLYISPPQLNLGDTGTTTTVALANRGGLPLDWTASDNAEWLAASVSSGTIAPKGAVAVSLSAHRGSLAPGTYTATLSIASNGGSASVAVSMAVPGAASPSPPPPSGSTALAGRMIDQFDGHGLAGLNVEFAGRTVTTDASGAFAVPGAASSSLRDLRISGPGVHRRLTFARGSDTMWRLVPSSFDLDAFDDVAREYEPRTIRWVVSPRVYIDTRPDAFPDGPHLDAWISEVQAEVASFVSEWTDGVIEASAVEVGSSPPADGTPGVIVIHFSEDASIYGAQSTVGLARTFWTADRAIWSAVVWLRFARFSGASHAARRAIVGHELGHALGMGHMDGSTSSIMTPLITSTSLTSFDANAGALLYNRSPGNTAPDVDSATTYRGALAPSRAPGYYEWVCGGPGPGPSGQR